MDLLVIWDPDPCTMLLHLLKPTGQCNSIHMFTTLVCVRIGEKQLTFRDELPLSDKLIHALLFHIYHH